MSDTLYNPHTFSIKTQAFEGPLELLLDLVEKRKFLINDISLASVTDEYMAKVSQMQELSLPNTAQFIVLAATLLLENRFQLRSFWMNSPVMQGLNVQAPSFVKNARGQCVAGGLQHQYRRKG